MKWKATVDQDDFQEQPADSRLQVAHASFSSYASGNLTEDVKAEHAKLEWADTVIFQFPIWWFSVPAILKGWIDRVYACGYAYGVGEHSDKKWGERYGEGRFLGKRAMLVVTIGGWAPHYSARGINGPIEDVLFPIQHGVLFYPGFSVLPPILVYQADRVKAPDFTLLEKSVRERIRNLSTDTPIPFRSQNGGDYLIPSMTLREGLEPKGATSFALHLK
jgi:NAD(P)H dehydrogenase (quinone)